MRSDHEALDRVSSSAEAYRPAVDPHRREEAEIPAAETAEANAMLAAADELRVLEAHERRWRSHYSLVARVLPHRAGAEDVRQHLQALAQSRRAAARRLEQMHQAKRRSNGATAHIAAPTHGRGTTRAHRSTRRSSSATSSRSPSCSDAGPGEPPPPAASTASSGPHAGACAPHAGASPRLILWYSQRWGHASPKLLRLLIRVGGER